MGWFKKIGKEFNRAFSSVGEATTNVYHGITGKTQAEAVAAAQRQAEEEARLARVAAAKQSQFAETNSTNQVGNVVLGTEETDTTLEEQLKRMRR